MDKLTVEQNLFLSGRATFKGKVILTGVKVGGLLDADGLNLRGRPDHGQPQGRAELVPERESDLQGDVILTGAQIGGQLATIGSTFGTVLYMDSLRVEQSCS